MKLPALKWPAIAPPPHGAPPVKLSKRLFWMAGIWAASVIALLIVAELLRLTLRA
ncbi:MAG: DUF2474 domain-containing protein [Herminiimonas sp.]|nr:DUF2474 domain-containing protein [Herminiimonas sp.]